MVKTAAILFGLVFLLIGILGFVPAATHDVNGMPMLLGIFHVNFAHNIVHLASGAVFLLCGMAGAGPSRTWLHVGLAVVMLFLGFGAYGGDTVTA